jgi:hypothetical protein
MTDQEVVAAGEGGRRPRPAGPDPREAAVKTMLLPADEGDTSALQTGA